MPKPKKATKQWSQRAPSDKVDAALKKGAAHPDSQLLKLHKLNPLVCWLLDRYGAGKLKETP